MPQMPHILGERYNARAIAHRTRVSSNPKPIVFLSLAYAPVISGAERQLQSLCERWTAEGQPIWVLTLAVPGLPHEEVVGGVRVVRLKAWWRFGLSWFTFAFSALRYLSRQPVPIHSLWAIMLNVTAGAAILAGWRRRAPVVVKLTAGGAGGNIRVLEGSMGGHARAGWLLRQCSRVIILNEGMRQELASYRLAPSTVHLIPNGVDTETFAPASAEQREAARRQWAFAPEDLITLFVGRLDVQKNLFMLLESWAATVRSQPTARLVLAGDGPERDDLRSWIAGRSLESHVRLLGRQTAIHTLYHASDLFVLPSHYEGMSNALLEAMACGLPVIASDIPGNTDAIEARVSGILLPADVADRWTAETVRLLTASSERRRLGEAARAHVLRYFSQEATLRAYQRLAAELDAG
jgi:glycosyltransferase involved in cell wall biosynthesis